MEDRYLFKAKRIDNGEWVEGFPFLVNDVSYYKYLDIAKQIFQPKSIGDKNIELEIENNEPLMNLVKCNLEDDEMVENMCSSIAECLDMTQNYLILLFHDDYDVMKRTSYG